MGVNAARDETRHSLGLGENPPTARDISPASFFAACPRGSTARTDIQSGVN